MQHEEWRSTEVFCPNFFMQYRRIKQKKIPTKLYIWFMKVLTSSGTEICKKETIHI